jgi:hypothetical protein
MRPPVMYTCQVKEYVSIFQNLMEAFREARLSEAEDLESLHELNCRLEQISERRACGVIEPHGEIR